MVRSRRRLLFAVSVLALECTWGGYHDSGQSCPEGPVYSTPPTDCSSAIAALTLGAAADTIQVGRGATLTGQITSPSVPAAGCQYNAGLASSDSSIASLVGPYVSYSPYNSGSALFSTDPIGGVIGRAPGKATVSLKGGTALATISLTVIAPLDDYVAVSPGGPGVCVLDGAGRPYCTTTAQGTVPLLMAGMPAFSAIDAGSQRVCGLSAGKRVDCWTYAYDFPIAAAPEQVSLPSDAAAVDAGGTSHACALTAGHDAYCWGSNASGQLGITGDFGYVAAGGLPVAVAGGHRFQKLALGGDHTCGLGDDGSVWCWGNSSWGEVGLTTVPGGCGAYTLCQPSPAMVRIGSDTVFTDVASGYDHTCALDLAGTAYCWGHNFTGALGTGDTLSGPTPRKVAGNLAFVSLTAGMQYSCGLTASGDAYCWGADGSGQLGSGQASGTCGSTYYTTPCETAPAKVGGALRFSSLSAGNTSTCGLASDGAWCWGGGWVTNAGSTATPVRMPGQK